MTYRDGLPPGDPYLPPGVTQRMIDEANQPAPFDCPSCGRRFEDMGEGERLCPRCGWNDLPEEERAQLRFDGTWSRLAPVCGKFMPEDGECPF